MCTGQNSLSFEYQFHAARTDGDTLTFALLCFLYVLYVFGGRFLKQGVPVLMVYMLRMLP